MSEGGTGSAGSSFDPTKAGAFAGHLLGALNDGAFCPMASAKGLNSDADLLLHPRASSLRQPTGSR